MSGVSLTLLPHYFVFSLILILIAVIQDLDASCLYNGKNLHLISLILDSSHCLCKSTSPLATSRDILISSKWVLFSMGTLAPSTDAQLLFPRKKWLHNSCGVMSLHVCKASVHWFLSSPYKGWSGAQGKELWSLSQMTWLWQSAVPPHDSCYPKSFALSHSYYK